MESLYGFSPVLGEHDELDHVILARRWEHLVQGRIQSKDSFATDAKGMKYDCSRSFTCNRFLHDSEVVDIKIETADEGIEVNGDVLSSQSSALDDNDATNRIPASQSHNVSVSKNFLGSKVDTFDGPRSSVNRMLGGDATARKLSLDEQKNIFDGSSGDIDHIVLKDRLWMCLQRKLKSGPVFGILQLSQVKVEPSEGTKWCEPEKNFVGNLRDAVAMKVEPAMGVRYQDEINHFQYKKLVKRGRVTGSNASGSSERSAVFSCCDDLKRFSFVNSRRDQRCKRRKYATCSVKIAMEEDAPELLQILVEHGVSTDELRLYGEDLNDPIDESYIENSFMELEAVISKLQLSFQRTSFEKLAPVHCKNGTKPTYSLLCLFSLVERTRYLQFRNIPAEWGWCRDLNSFIFVFKQHNRIILERPEYGYATYFFELMDSLPVDWQIKRLITVMHVINCGRLSLIENKALSVGEDIDEEDAKVLVQFGWKPNRGLGTMLNFYDRVIHDRKNEIDSSAWRSKISRMLTDGLNGGTLACTSILMKFTHHDSQSPDIKLEM